jgi:glycosyltransferase involved in cell wall biosynthesis
VIVSDQVGCHPDLVRDGENGAVFRCGDVDDLKETLCSWIDDEKKRLRAGRASLEIINGWGLEADASAFSLAVKAIAKGRVCAAPKKPKVAFVFTHEIQYFTNVLDELHRRGRIDLLSIYALHTKSMLDTGFNRVIEWDNRSGTHFPSVVLSPFEPHNKNPSARTWCWNIFAELTRYDPDVIHLNGYSAAIQWLAWSWAVLHRRPIFLRGDGDTFGGTGRSGGTTIGMLLSRLFTSMAAHVFYQGLENKAFWLQRGAKQDAMSWIPCVPDNEIYQKRQFASPAERQAFRSQTGAEVQDTVFVVSGKLDPRKRPQDAVEVLNRLRGLPCRVWFLGSGVLESSLKQLADSLGVAERTYWWGFRNQSELPQILQAADVLLHPSQQDPWPYSVLEGAMCGLALLLSDQTGSHPDLIGSGGAGLTFRCGDLDDMARTMRLASTNIERLSAWRAAAIRVGLDHTETRFCEIFEQALQGTPECLSSALLHAAHGGAASNIPTENAS